MKFRLTVLIVFSLCLSNVFADEGMWLLGNLRKNKQTDRVMKELGLQMPVNKIYDPKKPCLADAVVSFGGFCSEWWFPKTVWCLPIIIVALAVFSNILQWSMITRRWLLCT